MDKLLSQFIYFSFVKKIKTKQTICWTKTTTSSNFFFVWNFFFNKNCQIKSDELQISLSDTCPRVNFLGLKPTCNFEFTKETDETNAWSLLLYQLKLRVYPPRYFYARAQQFFFTLFYIFFIYMYFFFFLFLFTLPGVYKSHWFSEAFSYAPDKIPGK